jgi:pyridinium-3,5-biscarboxylic acid mononucleotide sulfurtransferase
MSLSEQVDISRTSQKLVDWFTPESFYVVALSGGVDSSVAACAASLSGCRALAVTARSPSVSKKDLSDARSVAEKLGIDHQWMDTRETLDPNYRENNSRRCFFCKSHLFAELRNRFPSAVLVTGTNRDDLDDYRPGLDAAKQAGARSPLAELGISKDGVRQLAGLWNLPVADKPASPCLASRIAYGVEVTAERLQMVEAAESLIKELFGLNDCRVRLHEGGLARIEVAQSAIALLVESKFRESLTQKLRDIGFRFVTLDLAGQRSGSLNDLIQVQVNHNGITKIHPGIR